MWYVNSSFPWTLAAIGLFLGVVLTTLYYLMSKIIDVPSLSATTKEMIAGLIFTAFLLGSIVTIGVILNTIFGSLACPAGAINCNHINVAYYSLSMIGNNLRTMYMDLYAYDVLISLLSSINIPLFPIHVFVFIFTINISIFPGLVLLSEVHTLIVEGIGYAYAMLIVKQSLLEVSAVAAPYIILPLGIFMRCMPGVSRTGSTLIAFSITLYFIMPLAFTMSSYIIFDYVKPSPYFIEFDKPSGLSTLCGSKDDPLTNDKVTKMTEHITKIYGTHQKDIEDAQGTDYGFWGNIKNVFTGAWGAIKDLGNIFTLIIQETFSSSSFYELLLPISFTKGFYIYLVKELVLYSQFLVVAVVTTVLEFIVIVTGHRSISPAIMGEMEIFGITKII